MRIILTIGLTIIFGCSNKITDKLYSGGKFTLNYYKSKDNFSAKILCDFYHFESENEKTIGVMNINGVLMPTPTNLNGITINVLPGIFKIESGFPGKKWTVIENLKISAGDSVVVKIYLEDDDRPLVD